ncbi:MAG: oligosaccharide flippase family protein [Candidatus Omnitrophica bacterium]|nr:oligosaccharide flippase family protein [Candidatus Omnitrophota bacterium]
MSGGSPHPALAFGTRLVSQAVNNGFFFLVQLAARMLLVLALGRALAPEQYGIYALLATTVMFSMNLLRLGAHQYYEREVPGRPREEAQTLLKSIVGLQTCLIVAVAGALLAIPGFRDAAGRFLQLRGSEVMLYLTIGIILCDIGATELGRYLVVRTEIERSNLVSFLQNAAWALAVFGLFAVSPARVTLPRVLACWLSGAFAAVVLGIVFAGPQGLWRAPLRPALYATAVRFGLPLMLTNVSNFVIGWSDRYFIGLFHSTHEVGVYAYQYGLVAMVVALTATMVSSVLDPYALTAHNAGDLTRCRRLMNASVRYSLLIVLPILVVLGLWGRDLIAFLASEAYVGPRGLMLALLPLPVLMIIRSAMERVLFLERRTGTICRCYVGSAAVSLLLNAVLVPLHPYYGPASAMTCALLAQVMLLWAAGRSAAVRVTVGSWRLAVAGGCTVLSAVGLLPWLPDRHPVMTLSIATLVVCVIYGLAAWALQVLSPSERQLLAQVLGRIRSRLTAVAGVPQ